MAVNNQLNIATVPLPVYEKVVDLTSSQITSMYTTPIFAISAPGAHKVILVNSATLEYKFNSTGYAAGGSIWLQYTNVGSAGAGSIGPFLNSSGIGASSSIAYTCPMPFSPTALVSTMVNQGIYISNSGSNFTTGNGTIRICILYSIIATTS